MFFLYLFVVLMLFVDKNQILPLQTILFKDAGKFVMVVMLLQSKCYLGLWFIVTFPYQIQEV